MYQRDERKTVDRNLRLCTTDDEPQSQTDGYQSRERVCMFVMLLFSWLLFGFFEAEFCSLAWIDLHLPSSCDPPTSFSVMRLQDGSPCLMVEPCLAVPPCFPAHVPCSVTVPGVGTMICSATVPHSVSALHRHHALWRHHALQCPCALPTTGGLLERYEFLLIMHKSLYSNLEDTSNVYSNYEKC